jgi:predicted ATPase
VENTSQLFPALWGLWLFYTYRAEWQTAYELAQQLWNLAQQEQEPTLLLLAHRALGTTLFWLGEFVPAWEHLEQVIIHYNPQQHHEIAISYGGSDIKVHCLSFASLAVGWLGYLNQALRMSHESLALAKELSHSYSLAVASFFATWFHSSRREEAATQELAETAFNVSTEHGFPLWLTGGTALRGWALAEQGQAEEGVDQIRRGLSALRAMGTELFRPYGLTLLAETYGKVGQIEEGLTALAEALELVRKTDERFWEAEMYRLKGELLLRQGEPEADIEANFQQAITIARQQEAKSLELRAKVSLARLWQSQGKKEEARPMLAEIYNWFTEGFDTVDLKEAKALLEELS